MMTGTRVSLQLSNLGGEKVAKIVSVIGFVADQACRQSRRSQERPGSVDVVRLARRQEQGIEPAFTIGKRVDPGRAATARATDGLVFLPLFAPAAARCARITVLSTIAINGGSSEAARAANICCHKASLAPPVEPVEHRGAGPIPLGHRTPACRTSRNRCRMPLITRRSSTQGLSPKCGNNGSITAHCRSSQPKHSAAEPESYPSWSGHWVQI